MIQNAKTLPKRYYGLHMVEGVAEYEGKGGEAASRVLVGEETIKNMDPTFEGCPVYVHHVNSVDLDHLATEMDGVVVKSFFNPPDGKHWVEFMVTSDEGHKAILAGWKLSNAYLPTLYGEGGRWHNVEYAKEVMTGKYEHLAIVPNPRYEESIILTPEEFKAYNSKKALELQKLTNSKEEKVPMLNFFKKTKLENAADFETTMIALSSGTEKSIKQLVNEAEEAEKMKKDSEGQKMYANGEHLVKLGNDEMSVNELVEKHMAIKEAMDKKNEDQPDKDAKKVEAEGGGELKVDEADEESKKKALELKANEDKMAEEKKANEAKEKADKEAADKKSNAYFELLKNAGNTPVKEQVSTELSEDRVARGKARYGS